MSTHNIGFFEELTKIIFQLLSNIIKYPPSLFFWRERHDYSDNEDPDQTAQKCRSENLK